MGKDVLEGHVREQAGLVCALIPHAGHENGEAGHGADHDGIDEDVEHAEGGFLQGRLGRGRGMGHGRGAEAGLVGEDAAGNAHADGQEHGGAGEAALGGGGREGFGDDPPEHARHFRDVHGDDDEGEDNVDGGHEGHETAGYGADALHASKKNKGEQKEKDDARDPGGHGEGVLQAHGNGVDLYEVARAHAGDDAEDGEEDTHPGPFSAKAVPDEVHGAADPAA